MVSMPEIDVVKESLKVENASLVLLSVSLVSLVLLMVFTKGNQ